jgi:hypothetical protein
MRTADLYVLIGVCALVIFGLYAAVAGSRYNEPTTVFERLYEAAAGIVSRSEASAPKEPAEAMTVPPAFQKVAPEAGAAPAKLPVAPAPAPAPAAPVAPEAKPKLLPPPPPKHAAEEMF